MSKRKSISQKLRFEILKRDNFTCQWCGKSASQDGVVLEIDHINPVSKGGDNNILNLVASCFSCNRGKGAIKVDDNTVIAKQKTQMDLLQARREQQNLMFKWHQELKEIDAEVNNKIFQYVNDTLLTSHINPTGEAMIAKLAKKYELNDVLRAIDISAEKYFRFDENEELTQESAVDFLNKIGGVLYNLNQPVVQQKASYIKGICRNRFNYFNIKAGSIILNNYIDALRNFGWSDEQISADLDNEIMPRTKAARNWSEWRKLLEDWTHDITHNWKGSRELVSEERF